jgi:hypothetical protein
MNKLLEFFQSSAGELSSKRLGYLATIPASIWGTIHLCNKLIATGNGALAVDLWNSFLVFSAILGGFVSVEIIPEVIRSIKGFKQEIIIKEKHDKPNN